MSSRATTWNERTTASAWSVGAMLLRPLQMALTLPSTLYLITMSIFLFRPPDIDFYYADRIAFCVLVFVVFLRALACRESLPWVAGISAPMLGLAALAMFRALREPFDAQTWSLVASKFVVPFVLFHVAAFVFRGKSAREHFEMFAIVVLAYLIFLAIAFLAGARSLTFPSFILDESLGHHVNRARGPFLQAVANGVALTLLGLIVIVSSRKWRRVVLLLWVLLPLAVLATMTRAVWISFAVSTVAVAWCLGQRRWKQICVVVAAVGLLVGMVVGIGSNSLQNSILDRTEERAPVDIRMAVYEAGWGMFKERPLTGWTASRMYEELGRRMQGYRLRSFYIHNTYLSMLIEFGIPGLLLYLLLFSRLFWLPKVGPTKGRDAELVSLRRIWPILLVVFLFNALFVDMVYQFVNGLLFTVAGTLCAEPDSAA